MPDITIILTAAQAQRVQDAFTTSANPSPTIEDAKDFMIQHLRAKVLQMERAAAEAQIQPTPFEPA